MMALKKITRYGVIIHDCDTIRKYGWFHGFELREKVKIVEAHPGGYLCERIDESLPKTYRWMVGEKDIRIVEEIEEG